MSGSEGIRRTAGTLAILAGTVAVLATAGMGEARAQSCVEPVLKAEQAHEIPPGLLLAVSIVESATNGDPYPYAMNVRGRAIYAPNPDDGAKRLVDRRGRITAPAAVGCLQLSVQHHRVKFGSVREMLDPQANAEYGAGYLKRHFEELGSWSAAVQRYQGGSPSARRTYQCKVLDVLQQLDPVSAEHIADPRCRAVTPATRVSERVQREFLDNAIGAVVDDTADVAN
jgi:hypothetical protein